MLIVLVINNDKFQIDVYEIQSINRTRWMQCRIRNDMIFENSIKAMFTVLQKEPVNSLLGFLQERVDGI